MMRNEGMSVEEMFSEISRTGSVDESFSGLSANEPYYAFACPIDIECNVVGAVTVAEFTTGSVPMSDNVITFDRSGVSDITGFKPESVRGAVPEKIAPEVGLYRR